MPDGTHPAYYMGRIMALARTDLTEGAFPKTPANDFVAAVITVIERAVTRREAEIAVAHQCGETDERDP